MADLLHLRLTSINQPRAEMGRLAVELLESRRDTPSRADEQVVLTPSLTVRDSTAPPTQADAALAPASAAR